MDIAKSMTVRLLVVALDANIHFDSHDGIFKVKLNELRCVYLCVFLNVPRANLMYICGGGLGSEKGFLSVSRGRALVNCGKVYFILYSHRITHDFE